MDAFERLNFVVAVWNIQNASVLNLETILGLEFMFSSFFQVNFRRFAESRPQFYPFLANTRAYNLICSYSELLLT
jgi:hypothetical protein